MTYRDSERITIDRDNIYYDGQPIDKRTIQSIHISGLNSETAYYNNIDNYIVKLITTSKKRYHVYISKNEKECRAVVRRLAWVLRDQKNIKKYGSTLINVGNLRKVEIVKDVFAGDNHKRVNAVFHDHTRIRIVKTPYDFVANYYVKKIQNDSLRTLDVKHVK